MNVLEIDYDKILEDAYLKHKSLIVAFDFDNTVFDYHKKSVDYSLIIDLIKECDRLKFPLLCLTSNTGNRLKFIEYYLKEVLEILGIHSLDINNQYRNGKYPLYIIDPESFTKPYFNILLDDKAGLVESYNRLRKLVDKINNKEL